MWEDEYSHKNIDRATLINKVMIESNEYRRKFDHATSNSAVNKTLYYAAKEILYDRSGTRYESMRWIDGGSGNVLAKFDSMGRTPDLTGETHELKVSYSESLLHILKGYNNIVVLHNHPNSSAPSAGDFNSAFKHGYSQGFVVTHDGRVFKYTSNQAINNAIYDTYWAEFRDDGFDTVEAQIRAIQKIARNADIFIEEVIKQ